MSGRRRMPEPAVAGRKAASVTTGTDSEISGPEEIIDLTGDLPEVTPSGAPLPGARTYVADEDIPEGGPGQEDPDAGLITSFDDAMPDDPEPEADSLSPEEELMFSSLLTCGRRSRTIKVLDHTVVVETINGDDDLRIGMYAKPYVGSLGEQRAYQIAVVASGIRSVDGQPFVRSLFKEADRSALFDEKVAKVEKMYPHVILRIYRAILEAEQEFVELVDRLGKSNG